MSLRSAGGCRAGRRIRNVHSRVGAVDCDKAFCARFFDTNSLTVYSKAIGGITFTEKYNFFYLLLAIFRKYENHFLTLSISSNIYREASAVDYAADFCIAGRDLIHLLGR